MSHGPALRRVSGTLRLPADSESGLCLPHQCFDIAQRSFTSGVNFRRRVDRSLVLHLWTVLLGGLGTCTQGRRELGRNNNAIECLPCSTKSLELSRFVMRINPQNDSEDRHGPILQMAERRLRRIKSLLRASQLVETDRGRIHLRQVHPTARPLSTGMEGLLWPPAALVTGGRGRAPGSGRHREEGRGNGEELLSRLCGGWIPLL